MRIRADWLFIVSIALLIIACNEQPTSTLTKAAPSVEATPKVSEQSHQSLGRVIYEKSCSRCHDTGVAGAPKLGDRAAWTLHAGHGAHHLTHAVLEGKGAMPPRGGNPNLNDNEIEAAIQFILGQSL